MQPWAQNQEPIQLTWTAQHNTPQGLVTSWGGYTTHAIANPPPFQPPPSTQQPPGHPFTTYTQIPPQASLPAQPAYTAQQATLFAPQQPNTAPVQAHQPFRGTGGLAAPTQTPHWAQPPEERAYDWDSDRWNNPHDDSNYAHPIPTQTGPNNAAAQTPTWLPPPGLNSACPPQPFNQTPTPQTPEDTTPVAAHHHHCSPWSPNHHKNPNGWTTPCHRNLPTSHHSPGPVRTTTKNQTNAMNQPPRTKQTKSTPPITPLETRRQAPPPSSQPTSSTANAGIPPWERPSWGGKWGSTPSSSRGYPFRSSTPRTAGHGSQRVGNKLGKYNFKQRSRSGHRPRRPGPQPQQGPGWGIIAERDAAGDTPPNTDTGTGSKQDTAAHTEHQQRSRESPYERWQKEHQERAQQQHKPQSTATTDPDTQGDTQATQPSPIEETHSNDTSRGPPHFTGTLPPDIDIPTNSGGTDWIPLPNGCWEVVVKPTSIQEDPTSSAGLPPLRTVNVGQSGPSLPPLSSAAEPGAAKHPSTPPTPGSLPLHKHQPWTTWNPIPSSSSRGTPSA